MKFTQDFILLPINEIHIEAQRRKNDGWRYVQILAVNLEAGTDLIYSYMKDGQLDNLLISNIARKSSVPSISDLYLEAFVCENEIHDLFGISFDNLVIDFVGNFYKLSSEFPMTIISPEQIARKEKETKSKALDTKTDKAETNSSKSTLTHDEIESKLAGLDPEKAAKVRAAMEAKAKKAAQDKAGE